MIRTLTIAAIMWLEMLRKKDVYVLLILGTSLLVTLVSLNIFGLGGLVIYVKDIGLLMSWIFGVVLAISMSARALPQEEQRGTIFPLLAKPITRIELIAGKWLGATTVASLTMFIFYALIFLVVRMRGGSMQAAPLLQGYVLHCGALAILCGIGLLFSTHMNFDAAVSLSFVACAAAFLVVPRVPAFLMKTSGFSADALMALYNVLPHFEILDMRKRIVYDDGPLSPRTFAICLGYAACYAAALILLSWLAYRKKRFSRGNVA